MKVAESMIAAYKFLGIPQLIEPRDFMSKLIGKRDCGSLEWATIWGASSPNH